MPLAGRASAPRRHPLERASLSGFAGDPQPEGTPKRSSGIAWLSLWHGSASPIAVGIDDHARQQARRLRAHRQRALLPIGPELVLHDLPKIRIEDGLVLAGVGYT